MNIEQASPLSIGQCAALATIIEASAPKPGNVHRGADFDDLSYTDLIIAAMAIVPAIDAAPSSPLGETVLRAVRATRDAVGTNTNLGTILLIAPLATADALSPDGVGKVLAKLTPDDCAKVYEAIRLANAGGLGHVEQGDVSGPAPQDLVAAMRLAAGHDMVARQYAENFAQIFDVVVPLIAGNLSAGYSLLDSVVHAHVSLMSQFPDSLIARKAGERVAQESATRAAKALGSGRPGEEDYERALGDLDFWLRSDGHRRNPGTTADLIAAGLFVALRGGIIKAPWRLF